MKIKTVVVDDEKPALDEMLYLLEGYPQIEIVGTATDGQRGFELIIEQRPDLIFLDIEMPGMNGLEIAEKLYRLRDLINPQIVFTTAYDQFAINAFEVEALDYLLKPVSEERLKVTMDRLNLKQRKRPDVDLKKIERVPVDYRGRYRMIPITEILYFTTEGGEVQAVTYTGTYSVNTSLAELESELKNQGFFRCHRGYLVNLNNVVEVIPWFKGKYLLIMNDGKKSEVPVSRTYIKELCSIFGI